jgi:hypothetical protein
VRRESRVGLSHSGQYSARGSGSGLTYGIKAEDGSFLMSRGARARRDVVWRQRRLSSCLLCEVLCVGKGFWI